MSMSVSKIVAERNRRILLELVLKPGNDICADCKGRAPRWASYNLGIFICMNCASIHRKIGTHITKVKSITLDEWSKEQVEVMKDKGNVKNNALYNPDEARHPLPAIMIDSERDSELEKFIRSKYEFKRFMDRKSGTTSQHLTADVRAGSTTPRSRSTPLIDSALIERKASPGPPPPPKTPENLPSRLRPLAAVSSISSNAIPTRSVSQPLPLHTNSDKLTTAPPLRQPASTKSSIQKPAGQVWEDLVSLQEPSQSSSLPLQYSPISPMAAFPSQLQAPVQQQPPMPSNVPNPFMNLSLNQANATSHVTSPLSVSTPPQFPLMASAPLASPALHLGATNPFNQTPFSTGANGATFSTGSNPFSSPTVPATPSVQPVVALPTRALMHTAPLSYVSSQPSTSVPALSLPHAPFPAVSAPAMVGPAQNPFAQIGAPGQITLSGSGATTPFSAMQIRQGGFSGATPQTAFGTAAFLSQQQQQRQMGPNAFVEWAGQGPQGTH